MQPFDNIGGEFKARLREIATTTRSTVDNSTVTFRTARIDCEYTPKVIKHLAMGQLVAIPNVQALGTNNSYSLYEIADVYPMHYSMLTLDRSQPAAIRTEFMDLIQKEWEKGSKSTWIEIVAAPIGYVMKTTEDGIAYERRSMAPLTGSQVKLLSKDSIEQLICFKPPGSDPDDYSLGKLLGFTDGSIPFSVNLEQLIHYMSGTFAFSLQRDEPIVIRRDNRIEVSRIGDVVDRFFSDEEKEGRVYTSAIEALSFDRESFEVKWSPVQYVFRHKYDGNLLRFHARTGRTVTVTPGHSLFVLRDGEVRAIPSNELRPGDLLVGSRSIPSAELQSTSCSLLELFGPARGNGVVLVGLDSEAFEVVGRDVPNWQRWRWRHLRILPLSYWDMLKPSQRRKALLSYKGCRAPLPIDLEIDQGIARLLGYYAAEGRVVIEPGNHYATQFTLNREKDADIVRDISRILSSKFGVKIRITRHGNKGLRVTINHRILAYFL